MDTTVSTVVNEVTVTGRVYRRLIDKAAKLWQRISYWTKACDVEFDDGKTAQEKVGAIDGITSDFKIGKDNIAASSMLTKNIKDDLNEGIINDHLQFVFDKDGSLGYKKDGADAVIPFSKGLKIVSGGGGVDVKAPEKGMMVYAIMAYHHTGGGRWAHVVPNGQEFASVNPGIPAGLVTLPSNFGWYDYHDDETRFTYWWSDWWAVVWGPYNIKDYRKDTTSVTGTNYY